MQAERHPHGSSTIHFRLDARITSATLCQVTRRDRRSRLDGLPVACRDVVKRLTCTFVA